MKQSGTLKLINLLSDGEWHSNKELCEVAGWRFGGKIHQLKQKGFVFVKKGKNPNDKEYIEYWKLVSSPKYDIANGRIMTLDGKIRRKVKKLEREKTLFDKIKTLGKNIIKIK